MHLKQNIPASDFHWKKISNSPVVKFKRQIRLNNVAAMSFASNVYVGSLVPYQNTF